jgi:hypothetical protein
MPDANAMLTNSAEYGFTWTMWPVNMQAGDHASDKMGLGEVPIPVVTDVPKFNAAFPGLALKAMNGTSIRVTAQRIGRDGRERDSRVSAETLKRRIINWMLGVRVAVSQVVVKEVRVSIYVASDGTEFEDKNEMLEYEKALAE